MFWEPVHINLSSQPLFELAVFAGEGSMWKMHSRSPRRERSRLVVGCSIHVAADAFKDMVDARALEASGWKHVMCVHLKSPEMRVYPVRSVFIRVPVSVLSG